MNIQSIIDFARDKDLIYAGGIILAMGFGTLVNLSMLDRSRRIATASRKAEKDAIDLWLDGNKARLTLDSELGMLRGANREAVRLLCLGVEIMSPDQVAAWQGVREFLDQYAGGSGSSGVSGSNPCQSEDDCDTPMWCRSKDVCPKRGDDGAQKPEVAREGHPSAKTSIIVKSFGRYVLNNEVPALSGDDALELEMAINSSNKLRAWIGADKNQKYTHEIRPATSDPDCKWGMAVTTSPESIFAGQIIDTVNMTLEQRDAVDAAFRAEYGFMTQSEAEAQAIRHEVENFTREEREERASRFRDVTEGHLRPMTYADLELGAETLRKFTITKEDADRLRDEDMERDAAHLRELGVPDWNPNRPF